MKTAQMPHHQFPECKYIILPDLLILSNAFRICSEEFAGLLLLRTDGDLCFRRTDYVVRPSTGEEKRVFQEQVRSET